MADNLLETSDVCDRSLCVAGCGSLRPLLKSYLEISEEKVYQERFPWVDHVSEVRDPVLKETLFHGRRFPK